jgi:hypothetical protein
LEAKASNGDRRGRRRNNEQGRWRKRKRKNFPPKIYGKIGDLTEKEGKMDLD